MPRLNWKNILYNIEDAREQWEEIEKLSEEKMFPKSSRK